MRIGHCEANERIDYEPEMQPAAWQAEQIDALELGNWGAAPAPTDDGVTKTLIINPQGIPKRFYRLFKP